MSKDVDIIVQISKNGEVKVKTTKVPKATYTVFWEGVSAEKYKSYEIDDAFVDPEKLFDKLQKEISHKSSES